MDYKKLGLKCGLEVHQQLATSKLFCSCPSILRDTSADFTVLRQLRAVHGESGEVDVAALHEQSKEKYFEYEGFHDTTCLVELDEEPPGSINQAALDIVIEVSLLMKCSLVDAIQVMRKTVVDGSNTSGFQRTALIAQEGKIKTEEGDVAITNVSVEEDSARSIKDKENSVVYRLDRLGIPLIEIGTAPDIRSPQQCKEAAEKIGMFLRSTGKVKRGLGTIRQDVNVSIKGGERVEIKGAQDLKMIPTLVEYEALRQQNLIAIAKELKKKGKVGRIVDISTVLKNSESIIIKKTLKKRGVVLSLCLPGFAGMVGRQVQPGRRLGTEFSDYAKVKAGVGGLFHSDELPAYGITLNNVTAVRKKLRCGEKDAFVLIAADSYHAEKAIHAVAERAQLSLKGVPCEVRKANADGSTSYLRPMPGAARMYPETDHPLIIAEVKHISLSELIDDKIERFIGMGLSQDLATFIGRSNKAGLFEEFVSSFKKIKPAFIAELLTKEVELNRDHGITLNDNDVRDVLDYLNRGKLTKDHVIDALVALSNGTFDLSAYERVESEELRSVLEKIVSKNKSAPFGALMGLAMKELRGKASGKEISEILKELV